MCVEAADSGSMGHVAAEVEGMRLKTLVAVENFFLRQWAWAVRVCKLGLGIVFGLLDFYIWLFWFCYIGLGFDVNWVWVFQFWAGHNWACTNSNLKIKLDDYLSL